MVLFSSEEIECKIFIDFDWDTNSLYSSNPSLLFKYREKIAGRNTKRERKNRARNPRKILSYG